MKLTYNLSLLAGRTQFVNLVGALLLLLTASSASAIDLTPFGTALSGASYKGTPFQYDYLNSGDGVAVFDAPGNNYAPRLYLGDIGAEAALTIAVAQTSLLFRAWEGTDVVSFDQVLLAQGITLASPAGGSGSGLSQNDEANLQGIYQVGLWIFGAVLMLPIVLKVRPH